MKKQNGIGLIEVIISSLILALVVAGCLKVIIDANQVQRDNNERTIALYKLSSVLEVHRHNPTLVDAFTPILLSPSASVAEWVITDQTVVLPERDKYTAKIEWLNQYDGDMQGFSLVGSHMFGPRHLCVSADCPALGGPTTPPVYHEADKPPVDENGEVIVDEDETDLDDDGYATCKNGNNGFGNGDASAPGNSGPNNNANNAGNPDREDCEKTNGNGNNWKFPT
jgi:hypothetical protein